jgi:hypothetical protein
VRPSGLASGLARAVRPAGSAVAPRARVGPEDAFCGAGFAQRLETIMRPCVALPWDTKTGFWPPAACAGLRCGRGLRRDRAAAGSGGRCTVAGDGPPVVTADLWTVRGRVRNWCWSSLPGNPRCCCVRVCQSPVLTRGSGGRRALSRPRGGCRCRRWLV